MGGTGWMRFAARGLSCRHAGPERSWPDLGCRIDAATLMIRAQPAQAIKPPLVTWRSCSPLRCGLRMAQSLTRFEKFCAPLVAVRPPPALKPGSRSGFQQFRMIAPVPERASKGMRCGRFSVQIRGCPCNCKRRARCAWLPIEGAATGPCPGRPHIGRRPASQETCRRLVALALVQGVARARFSV